MMDFKDYQKQAFSTLISDHNYGNITAQLMAQILGLVGESGEFAEKIKKIIRDKNGLIDEQTKAELVKELGDILWYVNSVSQLIGSDLEEVASKNLQKVLSRKNRGLVNGSGDNR